MSLNELLGLSNFTQNESHGHVLFILMALAICVASMTGGKHPARKPLY